MRGLSDTLERLKRYRSASTVEPASTRLIKLQHRSANPGNLVGWYRMPKEGSRRHPLVVVLHGCTQTAAGYDAGSGWSQIADEFGFAVLFPEQSRQNNPNLCFNWFLDGDVRRDHGEVCSIREMIDLMIADHNVDPTRIFVTGLSAGGAMANALLTSYPEMFAGGAIIAGLPYGIASTVPAAFDLMRGQGLPPSHVLQQRLRSASSHKGPWPTVSVWHGTADKTVDEVNARAIVDQWSAVHKIEENPSRIERLGVLEQLAWKHPGGTDAIEINRISGMGHGTPIDASSGYGAPRPYMLDVGISSTEHIARSWGLTPSVERRTKSKPASENPEAAATAGTATPNSIQNVIESALRSAGLMK